jgi:hypothetical protein
MASFMEQDISTDYLISGHHKAVTGKDQFMRMRGMVLEMIKTRNQDALAENEVITKFVVQQGGDKQKSMIEALKVTEKDFFGSRKAAGKTEVEIFADYKNSFFKKSPRADLATFERTILNKWAKEAGGYKSQMDLMAKEQEIRGRAEWEQRLDRAANAAEQETYAKLEKYGKELTTRASRLGKSTDSKTLGQNTNNPLKAYGALDEMFEPIKNVLLKSFINSGKKELEALELASNIAYGVIEKNIDLLDSYKVQTTMIGGKNYNAVMFAKTDWEAATTAAINNALRQGADKATLDNLSSITKSIDDPELPGYVSLKEEKAK